jgi:phage I-like protein
MMDCPDGADVPATIAELLGHLRFSHLPLSEGEPDALAMAGDAASSNVRWHQIGVEGEWDGHHQGAFSLRARDFEQMVAQQTSAGSQLLVDYEHGSLFTIFNPQASEASGWADKLRIDQGDDGARLFARIHWTDTAAQKIRERKYRYLSPTILWRTKDRKTGADLGTSLHSIALTNTPFLEELPEVTLNSLTGLLSAALPRPTQGARRMFSTDQWQQLTSLVGLSADADPSKVFEALKARDVSASALATVCAALEVDASTPPDALARSIKALRATLADAPKQADLEALQQRLNATEAQAELREATSAGKIVASNREWAEALAKRDLAAFREWAASAPVVVPMERKQRASSAAADNGEPAEPNEAQVAALAARLPEAERKLAKQLGLELTAYCKRMYTELQAAYA